MNDESLDRQIIGNLLGVTTPGEVVIRIDSRIARSHPVRVGEYVSVEYGNPHVRDPVLARITEVELLNQNMPESILTGPEEFRRLLAIGDLSDGEILTAKAKIVGFIDEGGNLVSPRFSPPPGAPVRRASNAFLNRIFAQGDVVVGSLMTRPDVRVKLDIRSIVTRHLAILAMTGAGKGNTVAILVSRMLELGAPVVIIDPHGEYAGMRERLGDRLVVFGVGEDQGDGVFPLSFRCSSFSPSDYYSILKIPPNATKQMSLLRKAIRRLQDKIWGKEELIEGIKGVAKNDSNYKEQCEALLDKIELAPEFAILDKEREVPLVGNAVTPGLVTPGKVTIISLAGLSTSVQQAVVRRVASKILNGGMAWRKGDTQSEQIPCPVFMVVEEAHNFVPSRGNVSSKGILERIAAEGRKFGVGLCVVSQRPGRIDSNVLSQCNSMIILRIVNPFDQSNVENSAEALSGDLMKELPSLNTGEAVVIGPAVKHPALVKIDKFEGALGGSDPDVIRLWKEALETDDENAIITHGDDGAFDRRAWG